MASIHVQLSPSFVVPFAIWRRPCWVSARHHRRRPRPPSGWSRRNDLCGREEGWREQIRAFDSHEQGGDWPGAEEVSG